jgi:uncharacterized membrane protein HdeD (DUF308 family)
MDHVLVTYALYLSLTTLLTVWVGQTLFRNGRKFLVGAFRGDEEMADSVNHLLLVGFYLVNLGWVFLAMRFNGDLAGPRAAIELLAAKLGVVMLVLGVLHVFNLFALGRARSLFALATPRPAEG